MWWLRYRLCISPLPRLVTCPRSLSCPTSLFMTLSHMTRVSTQARSRSTAQWISDHVGPQRKYSPPRGKGVKRGPLRRARELIAGHYYLLSGHAAIGPYLKGEICGADSDRPWWCGGGKKQTRHHLFTECRVRRPQIARLWRDVGKVCGWKHPRAPSVKWLGRRRQRTALDLTAAEWVRHAPGGSPGGGPAAANTWVVTRRSPAPRCTPSARHSAS